MLHTRCAENVNVFVITVRRAERKHLIRLDRKRQIATHFLFVFFMQKCRRNIFAQRSHDCVEYRSRAGDWTSRMRSASKMRVVVPREYAEQIECKSDGVLISHTCRTAYRSVLRAAYVRCFRRTDFCGTRWMHNFCFEYPARTLSCDWCQKLSLSE